MRFVKADNLFFSLVFFFSFGCFHVLQKNKKELMLKKYLKFRHLGSAPPKVYASSKKKEDWRKKY